LRRRYNQAKAKREGRDELTLFVAKGAGAVALLLGGVSEGGSSGADSVADGLVGVLGDGLVTLLLGSGGVLLDGLEDQRKDTDTKEGGSDQRPKTVDDEGARGKMRGAYLGDVVGGVLNLLLAKGDGGEVKKGGRGRDGRREGRKGDGLALRTT
jgi:hypothetical protein